MLYLVDFAQKDFRGSVTFQYNTGTQPKHEFVVKVIQSNVIEVHANFGHDLVAAMRRFNEHCRLNIGRHLGEAIVDSVLKEFNISMENIIAMHMANLTSEEKQLMQQDAEFEEFCAGA